MPGNVPHEVLEGLASPDASLDWGGSRVRVWVAAALVVATVLSAILSAVLLARWLRMLTAANVDSLLPRSLI